MSTLAFLVAVAAWGSVFVRPGALAGWLLFMLFSALGVGFTLAGGFSYWWDASMRPGQASPWVLVWGLLTLVSQVWVFLRSILKDPTTIIIGDGDGDS